MKPNQSNVRHVHRVPTWIAGFTSLLCVALPFQSSRAESGPPPLLLLAGELQGFHPAGPVWADVLNARIKAGEPLPDWPVIKPPPDEASPAVHLKFWQDISSDDDAIQPTPAARTLLLAGILDDPLPLGEILRFLPETPEAAEKIAEILIFIPETSNENRETHRKTRAWIYQHSGLMRDQVMTDARRADWKQYVYNEKPDWALHAIQQREPEAATGLFTELAAGADPGLAVVAARLLLEKADASSAPKWREQLIAAAANTSLPEDAREIAVHALLKAEWSGRESWVLNSLENNQGDPEWFIREVWDAKKRWITELVRMTKGDDALARQRAVHFLVRSKPDETTLRPLLPWLEDPTWAGGQNYSTRRNFFQDLSEVRIPEAVPALILTLEKEKDNSVIGAAAEALAFHQAKDAIPAMRKALARIESRGSTDEIVESMHKIDGFTPAEMITGMEHCLARYPADSDRDKIDYNDDEPYPAPEILIGKYFADHPPVHIKWVKWADTIADRIVEIAPSQPTLAASMLDVLLVSGVGDASLATAAVLDMGTISNESMEKALRRCRGNNWKNAPFRQPPDRSGPIVGYAAVLGRDSEAISSILSGNDRPAQEALLAAARISGEPLDLDAVAILLDVKPLDTESENAPEVAECATIYLMDCGNPKTERLLLDHENRDEDMIPWNPQAGMYGGFEHLVRKASEMYDVKEGPEEVMVLEEFNGAAGAIDDTWTILAYENFGIGVNESRSGRIGFGKISHPQMAHVRDYVAKYRVRDLPELQQPVYDGMHYFFRHANADGIRYLRMNNPPGMGSPDAPSVSMFDDDTPYSKGIVIYSRLVGLFVELFSEIRFDFTYGDGIKVMVPKETAEITSVWKQGSDLRVLVERRGVGSIWRRVDPETFKLGGPVMAAPRESDRLVVDAPSGKPVSSKDEKSATLQKTSDGSGLWVADGRTYSGQVPETEIQQLNVRNSAKRRGQLIKGVDFDSSGMWVDVEQSMIYAAANGDLIRIPLKPD